MAPAWRTAGGARHIRWWSSIPFGQQPLTDHKHVPPQPVIDLHLVADLLPAVQHGRVVTAAELSPDLEQRRGRLLAHEIHGDLPWHDDLTIALLAAQQLRIDLVVPCD